MSEQDKSISGGGVGSNRRTLLTALGWAFLWAASPALGASPPPQLPATLGTPRWPNLTTRGYAYREAFTGKAIYLPFSPAEVARHSSEAMRVVMDTTGTGTGAGTQAVATPPPGCSCIASCTYSHTNYYCYHACPDCYFGRNWMTCDFYDCTRCDCSTYLGQQCRCWSGCWDC